MRIIDPSYVIDPPIDRMALYKHIEKIGRTCYKSEESITDESCIKFVKNLITKKHFPMLDHAFISVRFVHNRGFTHELVRHRIAAYAQESTRFCNYSKGKHGNELTLIKPYWADENPQKYDEWQKSMSMIEHYYMKWTMGNPEVDDILYAEDKTQKLAAQGARGILPQDIKAEIVATLNFTAWFHVFKLRAIGVSGTPHPDMRKVMVPLMNEFKEQLPEVFGEIETASKY